MASYDPRTWASSLHAECLSMTTAPEELVFSSPLSTWDESGPQPEVDYRKEKYYRVSEEERSEGNIYISAQNFGNQMVLVHIRHYRPVPAKSHPGQYVFLASKKGVSLLPNEFVEFQGCVPTLLAWMNAMEQDAQVLDEELNFEGQAPEECVDFKDRIFLKVSSRNNLFARARMAEGGRVVTDIGQYKLTPYSQDNTKTAFKASHRGCTLNITEMQRLKSLLPIISQEVAELHKNKQVE